MGNTDTKSVSSPAALHTQYKFLQKRASPAFGDLTIMQDTSSKQLVAIREQVFQSLKDYEQERTKLAKQEQHQHPNVVQLRQVNAFCEKQFCSSVYKILHAIEYLPIDLLSDLQQRRMPYTEHDLLALTRDITSAMQFLKAKGLSHGDLRMSTIFLMTSANGRKTVYKIAEPSVLRVMPGYLSVLTGHDTKGMLFSPKLMDGIRQKSWSPKHQVEKSDVFALGCILLECALCLSSDDMFDFKVGKILKDVLEERKNMVQASFSEDFQQILFRMLMLDETKRPDFAELAQLVDKVESPKSTVLRPIVNRQLPETLAKDKDTYTDKSKQNGADSYRSITEDKENQQGINPIAVQKQKMFKPMIVVVENPEENLMASKNQEPEEDFIEPMNPDNQSTVVSEPTPKIMVSQAEANEIQASEKPNPTPATTFSLDQSPKPLKENENRMMSGQNTHRPMFEFPSISGQQESSKMPSHNVLEHQKPVVHQEKSVFEYPTGVSFIRPEIQAILDEFKGLHKEPPKSPETHQNSFQQQKSEMNYQTYSKSPADNLMIPAEISAISELRPEDDTDQLGITPSRIQVYETYEDGSVYHGDKVSNLRDGKGKFYYSDGGMYDGDWKEGHIDGFGVLFYPNGCIAYQGQWRMDKFHGKGIVYNENPGFVGEFNYENFEELGEGWVKYEGDFVEDNKEGEGVLSLVNGEVFVGSFSGDCVQGRGRFYLKDMGCIEGIWKDNLFVRE